MPEGKFDHFPDAGHLFPAASDIIVPDIVEFFLVFPVDGLALGVEHGVGCNNTELFGLSSDYFELDGLEVASDNEKVAFLDGPVGIFEVWDEVSFSEVTR